MTIHIFDGLKEFNIHELDRKKEQRLKKELNNKNYLMHINVAQEDIPSNYTSPLMGMRYKKRLTCREATANDNF